MRGTTIAQVAAEAGVGVGTVSRVLNGSPSVSGGHAPAGARGDRHARLPAQPRRPCAVDRPHERDRRRRAVLHPAFGDRAPARRLAHARGRGLPADPARRGAARPAARRCSARWPRAAASTACSRSRSRRPTARRAAWSSPACRSCCSTATTRRCPRSRSTTSRAAGWRLSTCSALGHRRIAFLGDEEANLFGFDSSAHRREGFEAALAAAGRAARAGVDPAPAARARRRARRRGRAAGADPAADRRLRRLRRPGDRGAGGGAGSGRAGARGVVGHRLRRRGGRRVHRARPRSRSRSRRSAALGADLLLRALSGEAVESRRMPLEIVERSSTARSGCESRMRGNRQIQNTVGRPTRRGVHQ